MAKHFQENPAWADPCRGMAKKAHGDGVPAAPTLTPDASAAQFSPQQSAA
jgi:hypothetical protein